MTASWYSPASPPWNIPGPSVVPYQQVTLTQKDIDRVMALVEEIGLPAMTDERDDTQMNNVADAATYVVTYFDEGGRAQVLGVRAGLGSRAREAPRLRQPRSWTPC